MSVEQNKRSLSSEIALAGIALGLAIIFLSLSYVVPGIELIMVFFIPFFSALIVIKGNIKSGILFLLGVVCVSFIEIQAGFFNLLPNSIIGFCFGVYSKKFGLNYLSYLVLTLSTFFVELGLVFLIRVVFDADLISLLASVFSLERAEFLHFFPAFYLLISMISSLITFKIVTDHIFKFKKMEVKEPKLYIYSLILLVLLILSISSMFFYKSISLFSSFLALNLSLYLMFSAFYFNKKIILLYCLSSLVSLTAFFILIAVLPHEYLDLAILPLSYIGIVGIIVLKYKALKDYKVENRKVLIDIDEEINNG